MAKVLNSKDIKVKKAIDMISEILREHFKQYVGQPYNISQIDPKFKKFADAIIPKKD